MSELSYQKRKIQFVRLLIINDWRFKLYGITYQNEYPNQDLIKVAEQTVRERIKQIPSSQRNYHVGFVGIHDGKTANFIFIDWWADENELHHHIYISSKQKPTDLEYKTPTGLTACVWDLQLINFERNAWTRLVLQPENPRFDKYLNQRYSGTI